MPEDFVPSEFFENFYGIIANSQSKVEKVILKVSAGQANYMRSLPLHWTQEEIKRSDEYSLFELRICPEFDFQQEILSKGEDFEVLEPVWLRKEMAGKIKRMWNKYNVDSKQIMKDFAAIDFETANNERSSVCSVGIIIVRNGEIVDSFYSLIQPEPNYYNYWCTQVHGLTREDTEEAPIFPEVWKQIEPLIEGLPLVAHNKAFDESCLKAVFRCYQMDYPDYDFYCTCVASRKAFPDAENHQLHTISELCGYHLENHHHALADAEACAWIAREIL